MMGCICIVFGGWRRKQGAREKPNNSLGMHAPAGIRAEIEPARHDVRWGVHWCNCCGDLLVVAFHASIEVVTCPPPTVASPVAYNCDTFLDFAGLQRRPDPWAPNPPYSQQRSSYAGWANKLGTVEVKPLPGIEPRTFSLQD